MSVVASRVNWAHSTPAMVVGVEREHDYRVGYILTVHGAVGLYDQGRQGQGKKITSLSMVTGGRYISDTWEQTFSDRYLKTLATRFAAEVIAEVGR